MLNLDALVSLPQRFQREWMANLVRVVAPLADGHFYLVDIRPTKPRGYEENRIIVLAVDENGQALPGSRVAFAYSTAPEFSTDDFRWGPPAFRAETPLTGGSGQIEGAIGSVLKNGQPGGVTVFMAEAEYSSDYVTGCGVLPDHTGMHMIFQLRRPGVLSLNDQLKAIEDRLDRLEKGGR